jgi:hypothetical protein
VDYDYDAKFHADKIVRARKQHTCCECGEPILRGEWYERVTGLWDGTFGTFATCTLCREIRRAFFCGGWEYTAMWDQIQDELFPEWKRLGPWDCLAKLDTDAARAKMNDRYRWWMGDDDDSTADKGDGNG